MNKCSIVNAEVTEEIRKRRAQNICHFKVSRQKKTGKYLGMNIKKVI